MWAIFTSDKGKETDICLPRWEKFMVGNDWPFILAKFGLLQRLCRYDLILLVRYNDCGLWGIAGYWDRREKGDTWLHPMLPVEILEAEGLITETWFESMGAF